MGQAQDVVERYYEAFDRKDPAWKQLVSPDIRFDAPLQRARGAAEFYEKTEQFLQLHKATRVRARFEGGDQVSSLMEFDVTTPSGEILQCLVSELATVRDGKLAEIEIVYDPREFAAAFGLS